MLYQSGSIASTLGEATMGVQFLPRCANPDCHAPHPLAFNHWKRHFANNTLCPECGGPASEPGKQFIVPAVVTGFWAGVAYGCFWVAKQIAKLIRSLEK